MLHKLYLDRKKRILFFQFEKLRIVCKYIEKSSYFSINHKIAVIYLLQNIPRNCSFVRIHNFCIESGRSRGVFKFLGLSRIRLRTVVNQGSLPGFVNHIW